jgi:hypothetical protein
MHTAAFRGKVLVDGDGAGRAVPELELVTFSIYQVPISPMAISDAEGNAAILFVRSASKAEDIARQISIAFRGNAGIALYPMRAPELRRSIVQGTLSLSHKVGQLLERAKSEGKDPAEELARELGAFVLGEGVVEEKTLETREGFDFGRVVIRTREGTLKVFFKNENIVATLNEHVVAMAPDLICWVSREGEALTNVDIEAGMEVKVIGFKADEKLRTQQALEAFRHLYSDVGFEGLTYKPIEELQ